MAIHKRNLCIKAKRAIKLFFMHYIHLKINQKVPFAVSVSTIKRYALSQKLKVNASLTTSKRFVKKIDKYARQKGLQSYDVQVCI